MGTVNHFVVFACIFILIAVFDSIEHNIEHKFNF